MTTQIPVTSDHAQRIQESAVLSVWSFQNLGPGTVYIGPDQSVTQYSGYPVQAGVSLPLAAGHVVYAICAPGQSAVVATSDVAQAQSASIIAGTVNANISGPVAISGGTLTGISSIVAVSGVVQTEAANGGHVIGQYINTIPGGSGYSGAQNIFSLLDVSAYSSIAIVFQANGPAFPSSVTIAPTGPCQQWQAIVDYASGTYDGIAVYGPQGFGYPVGSQIVTPAAGDKLSLTLHQWNQAALANWTLTTVVIGYYANQLPNVNFGTSFVNNGTGPIPTSINNTAATPNQWVIGHDSRGIIYSVNSGNTAWSGRGFLYIPNNVTTGTTQPFKTLFFPGTANTQSSLQLNSSLHQLAVSQETSAATGTQIYEPAGPPIFSTQH